MIQLDLDAIALDADLQPRAKIDDPLWQDYAAHITEGYTFPPVTVFFDGVKHWLADGYHRWHAHKAVGLVEIAADVRQGSKRDALLFSLAANSVHGKRRSDADFRKAFEIAVRNEILAATDAEAVVHLLKCTPRWADELTRSARERAKADRDAAIQRERGAGKTVREIARSVGTTHSTVVRTLGAKENTSEMHQGAGETPPPFEPRPIFQKFQDVEPIERPQAPEARRPTIYAAADAVMKPQVKAWGDVVNALRVLNELTDNETLFAAPEWSFSEAIEREVSAALSWLQTFNRRFQNERPARRRA